MFSMEIRVKGDDFFFIDPCCRFPSPGSNSQMLLYENFPEIIWAGANGELVEPETSDDYVVECGLTAKGEKDSWRVLDLPASLRGQVALRGACEVDGHVCLPPHEAHGDEIGYLGVTGKSIEECVDAMKELAGELPDGVSANTSALFELLQEAHSAEEQGVPVSDDELPEPVTAVDTGE